MILMLKDLKKLSLPEIEEKVLDLWKEKDVFKKTQNKNKDKEKFVFYEGPPTANGKPGIHHVLSRAFKDVVLRFQTMQGKNVLRRGGWDTHGLPVEIEVEKNLGLNSKTEIEEYGIDKFNKKCKESVWKYKDEWENLTDRMGYWLDMDDPYITYDNSYIESIWWIMKEIDKKGLLYKGHKVVPWCTRCGTGLSSHELAQGYETVTDRSVVVKFKIQDSKLEFSKDKPSYLLAWTTTPWTLPGNVALAVGKDIEYIIVEKDDENLILAKDLVESVMGEQEFNVVDEIKGRDLVGVDYKPLFEVDELKNDNSYKVYPADFVTTEDGTGIVHTAVMYGEDDYELGKETGLPQYHTVNETGKFVEGVEGLSGMYVKSNKTEDKILEILESNNSLLKVDNYKHEYPHCWRCGTAVLYYARNSWFIEMTKVKDKLIEENESINWLPTHIKHGRFGEWLQNLKDWAISRERYWGTPMPVWECESCDNRTTIGSFKELSDKISKPNNNYIFIRHGQAEHNARNITNGNPGRRDDYKLTEKGVDQVRDTIKDLKKKNIDIIYSSDFLRTKQTAELIADEIGAEIVFDERLRETNVGDLDGQPTDDYHNFFNNTLEKFKKPAPNGENLRDISKRVWDFVSEMEKEHKDNNILIVSHDYVVWMADTLFNGWSEEESAQRKDKKDGDGHYVKNAEFIEPVLLSGVPRNDHGMVDPHRPYVDSVEFKCDECGKDMKRVSEVLDVWFDSGAMPFAQAHHPFEEGMEYPAEYIVEGIDQTRGWFYTLLAISSLLDKKAPYENVISLGLVLDKNGKKMSKSKGNTVDPWEVAQNYGLDVARWYFYSNSSPGEPTRFDEEELKKITRGIMLTAYNSLKFLTIYRDRPVDLSKEIPKDNILDRWIVSRMAETSNNVKDSMSSYNITKSARLIERFVDDLSKWYIRRSRKSLQRPDSQDEYENTSAVLVRSLLVLSKIISPFTPFFAEALYQSLKEMITGVDSEESVHLEDWPVFDRDLIDEELMENMEKIRDIASVALSQREEKGIKVRQPLSSLSISSSRYEIPNNEELLSILEDEVNIKEVILSDDVESVELNTQISDELKEEGFIRELIRSTQQMRAKAGLEPSDRIVITFNADKDGIDVIEKHKDSLREGVGADELTLGSAGGDEETVDIGGTEVKVSFVKK